MSMVVHAVPQEDYEAWIDEQLQPAEAPDDELAAEGMAVFEQQCTSCHLVEGLNDDTYEGAAQTSGAAPNLTHLASRGTYAGSIFNLWTDQDGNEEVEIDEIGGHLERNQLEAWLRDPPGEKPLAPLQNRGMPNLGLAEGDIDALVAYLTTLD